MISMSLYGSSITEIADIWEITFLLIGRISCWSTEVVIRPGCATNLKVEYKNYKNKNFSLSVEVVLDFLVVGCVVGERKGLASPCLLVVRPMNHKLLSGMEFGSFGLSRL